MNSEQKKSLFNEYLENGGKTVTGHKANQVCTRKVLALWKYFRVLVLWKVLNVC